MQAEKNCTIYQDAYSKKPFHITVETALKRIQSGVSREQVENIRSQLDKSRRDKLKVNLPSVCFSGVFNERKDELIIKHSGFIVLDFDNVFNPELKKTELSLKEHTYACWISPSQKGVKLLIRLADPKKHIEHFEALRDIYPDVDKSGSNVARLCFESYDPDIFINPSAKVFTTIKKIERVQQREQLKNEIDIYDKIVKWLTNKGDSFVEGERNIYIFKLASACCRFGLNQETCEGLIVNNYEVGTNTFSQQECMRTIQSAYKSNRQLEGTAHFENERLIDSSTKQEVSIDKQLIDDNVKPTDVIYGEDAKEEAMDIFHNGYKAVSGINCYYFDELFKLKEGEITLLSGYGNYGKSTFRNWFYLMRTLVHGDKFAFFTPEDNSAEFYHDMVEMLLGKICTPDNTYDKPTEEEYTFAYNFISEHFFFVYPKTLSPTPEYIKSRFLELIIKEGVKGVVIDPFNQLFNDYRLSGGRTDKYLETFLSDCSRFSHQNNIFFMIVAHPSKPKKDASGNYPCPDVYDIADGAMWNNKMDNILIYHRDNHVNNPQSDISELHTKKIRRQKSVGKKGNIYMNFRTRTRRFIINNIDFMEEAILKSEYYKPTKKVFSPERPVANYVLQPSQLFEKQLTPEPREGEDKF